MCMPSYYTKQSNITSCILVNYGFGHRVFDSIDQKKLDSAALGLHMQLWYVYVALTVHIHCTSNMHVLALYMRSHLCCAWVHIDMHCIVVV